MGLPRAAEADLTAGNVARVVPVEADGDSYVDKQGVPPHPEAPDQRAAKVTRASATEQALQHNALSFRSRSTYWVHSHQADLLFGGVITLNAIWLGLETDARTDDNEKNAIWLVSDSLFNSVFLIELFLRIRAERQQWAMSLWNIFDAGLVAVGVIDSWLMPLFGLNSDVRFASVLRIFRLLRLVRVLRVLRLFRYLKELMLLVAGITSAMRAMVWGLLLLAITIFMCSMLMTKIVGKSCCEEDDTFQKEEYKTYFGTLPATAFTLFQFTMEFQPDICRETWDDGPWLTIFFLGYTMFTNITLLNTVASVIVEDILRISSEHEREKNEKKQKAEAEKLERQLEHAFTSADLDGDMTLSMDELVNNSNMKKVLKVMGVEPEQAMALFFVMDVDSSGQVSRDEFNLRLKRVNKPPETTDLLKVECQVQTLHKRVEDGLKEMRETQQTILEYLARLDRRQDNDVKAVDSPSFGMCQQESDAKALENSPSFGIRPSREGWSSVQELPVSPMGTHQSQPSPPQTTMPSAVRPPSPQGLPQGLPTFTRDAPFSSRSSPALRSSRGDDSHFFV